MLLLGVLAAQAEGAVAAAGSYDLLETEILTGSQASVTFSSLNSTYGADYQHLQIRAVVRTSRSSTSSDLKLEFNADTTATNYYHHLLFGNGSIVGSTGGNNPAGLAFVPAANATADVFGAFVTDILDPFDTSKYTTSRTLSGMEANDDGIRLYSHLWKNTAALTSITIDTNLTENFVTGSRISLYGLKASA